MKGIIFDLKKFRLEQLNGMSQEEFASQIGISQDKVSRMESNPDQITLPIIIQIAEHFGMTLNDLIEIPSKEVKALRTKYTWKDVEDIKQILNNYMLSSGIFESELYRSEVKELDRMVKTLFKKPKIAFIGRSDVGKSTMINKLLGEDRLPAKWTPTTSIAIHIKHIEDRPDFMDEDVWIFKSEPEGNELWDDMRLYDKEYCCSLKLSAGNYDLLNSYGTRKGEHFASGNATSAVVFIDSDMLLNCDIIDLPGYGTGDRVEDDSITLKEKNKADIVVYLSIANGFMRSEDIAYVNEFIPALCDVSSYGVEGVMPLSNLFVVASQAHIVNKRVELDDILDQGCTRLVQSMTEDVLKRCGGKSELRKRFFTYTSNSLVLREDFEKALIYAVETLPKIIKQKAVSLVMQWANSKDELLRDIINGYNKIIEEREKAQKILEYYIENEPKRRNEYQCKIDNVKRTIQGYKKKNIEDFEKYYTEIVTVSKLEERMKNRNVKNKKEEIQAFSSYVCGILNEKAESILNESTEDFKKEIESFISSFEETSQGSFDNDKFFALSMFNKEQAFAAGLAGAVTYGALAIWAATCGNLGGYILVAKGVSLLSALGVSVGGTAAATSAVAAIGGPAVLGVALAVIATLAVFAALSGTWRKSVAKKMTSAFNKEGISEKIKEVIMRYWNDTETAFVLAANNLDMEWERHLDSLKNKIYSNDTETILAAVREAEMMRNFLQNIPLFDK